MPDPSDVLQACFLVATSTILFLSSCSPLRSRFLAYGSRATIPPLDTDGQMELNAGVTSTRPAKVTAERLLTTLLDGIAGIQVPHEWFIHFYVVSVVSSAFWAFQILTRGIFFTFICERTGFGTQTHTMSVDQVFLTWSLMSMQGVRRLLESVTNANGSASKMFFMHWLLGLLFYLAMGIAIWVEGAEALLSANSVSHSITMTAPSLRTIASLPLFILASGVQHDCHMYLASLPKYTLPIHPNFQSLICPHYTAECLIYFSLSVLAAPNGLLFNRTILAALVFVSVNLSVTASTAKEWHAQKFGKETVRGRWKMIPYLY